MAWQDWVELTLCVASAITVSWIIFPLNLRMNELWLANRELGELQNSLYDLKKRRSNPWAKFF